MYCYCYCCSNFSLKKRNDFEVNHYVKMRARWLWNPIQRANVRKGGNVKHVNSSEMIIIKWNAVILFSPIVDLSERLIKCSVVISSQSHVSIHDCSILQRNRLMAKSVSTQTAQIQMRVRLQFVCVCVWV